MVPNTPEEVASTGAQEETASPSALVLTQTVVQSSGSDDDSDREAAQSLSAKVAASRRAAGLDLACLEATEPRPHKVMCPGLPSQEVASEGPTEEITPEEVASTGAQEETASPSALVLTQTVVQSSGSDDDSDREAAQSLSAKVAASRRAAGLDLASNVETAWPASTYLTREPRCRIQESQHSFQKRCEIWNSDRAAAGLPVAKHFWYNKVDSVMVDTDCVQEVASTGATVQAASESDFVLTQTVVHKPSESDGDQ